ncbi:MAG TPA: DnaJ domain-containing protein, partial [Nocardioides sp.]|nr:DnaJ domain-containing protein [Nocardioides sp.]
MTPTWYDLLGVAPDASADEIRTAWKAAIADLDPTDRRFKALNEAAEVLLDKKRRATYDAGLEPETDEPTDVAPPLTRSKLSKRAQRATTVSDWSGETEAQLDAPDAAQADPDSRTTTRLKVPAWLLAALAILVALALAAAGYLYAQPSDSAIADGTSEAQGAAEHAATTILAYDYRHLDADQKAAGGLMTSSYQKKYDALFSQIAANAPDLKAVVSAQVIASGIVRSGEDRVQVLVFVNRPTQRKDQTEPVVYRDQVVMTMAKSGGDWLVDDMDTNQL